MLKYSLKIKVEFLLEKKIQQNMKYLSLKGKKNIKTDAVRSTQAL